MLFRHLLIVAFAALLLAGCGSASERSAAYVERAREYFAEDDYVKARLDLRNAIKIDPENVEARLLLVDVAERESNFRTMYNQLTRVLAIEPDNVEAHVRLGGILLLGGGAQNPQALAEIREHVEAALELEPQNADARVLDGALKRQDGDREGAFARAREVLAEDPGNVGAIALLTSLYLPDDPEAALVTLERGIEASPDSAVLHLRKVGLLAGLERWEAVEAALLELQERFPEEKSVAYRLVAFYTQRQRLDDAEAVLEALVARYPDDTTARLEYAEFLANHRAPERAEEVLRDYVESSPQIQDFRFALGTLYSAQERYEDAETVYRAIIDGAEQVDDVIRARNQLATLFLRQDRREPARALIDEVLAQAPSDVEALILRGSLRLDAGQVDDAIADLRSAYRNDPSSERALALLAQAHLQAGDVNLAEERLRDLRDAAPESTFARDRLATLLAARGQFDDALEMLQDDAAPQTLDSVRLLARVLIQQQRFDEARAAADALVERGGEAAVAGHFLAGRAYQAEGRTDEALVRFEQSATLGGMTPELLSSMTTTYVAAGRPEEALPAITAWREENPERHEGHTLAGLVYARLQRWEDARAALNRSVEIAPERWTVYRDLAGVALAMEQPELALADLERGIEALPENGQLRLLSAQVHESRGEYMEAIGRYEQILELAPESVIAANNLAALIADNDQSPERLQYALDLTRALRTSDNPVYLDTVGWVNYRLGNFAEAVALLEQAVDAAREEAGLQAQLPQLRYHLGMAYLRADQPEDARRELQAAVDGAEQTFQGLDEARETLAQL